MGRREEIATPAASSDALLIRLPDDSRAIEVSMSRLTLEAAAAGIALLERLGAEIVSCAFIVELPDLGGRTKLEAMGMDLHAICAFDGL